MNTIALIYAIAHICSVVVIAFCAYYAQMPGLLMTIEAHGALIDHWEYDGE